MRVPAGGLMSYQVHPKTDTIVLHTNVSLNLNFSGFHVGLECGPTLTIRSEG
jgi:hypothetical protein